MNFIQFILVTVALSGPIATLLGFVLAALCFVRSCRARNVKFALVSGLGALTLLVILGAIIVVWFIYGVAHTGKDATTDFIVIAGTVAPAYIGAFVAWRFLAYLKNSLILDVAA
jgi:hypothetical protein